jgi:hypothetical protein
MSSANIILGDPVGNLSGFARAEAALHARVRFNYRKLISAIVKMTSDQRRPMNPKPMITMGPLS